VGTLSDNFNRSEFECSCGCNFDTVDVVLLESLEVIRKHFGQPITITSACRCPKHNALVGGAQRSQHVQGRAADIQVRDTDPSKVADFAEDLGLSVGRYNYFTHVDSRTGIPARWSA
jgi:uncharacterized protein YcbK (DUF882 family)